MFGNLLFIEVLNSQFSLYSTSFGHAIVIRNTVIHKVTTCICSLCRLRQRSSELIVYMSIATIGSNITVLSMLHASRVGTNISCSIYGFFAVFFYIAGALWATVIANTLSMVLVQRHQLMAKVGQSESYAGARRNRLIKLHSFVWIVSAANPTNFFINK